MHRIPRSLSPRGRPSGSSTDRSSAAPLLALSGELSPEAQETPGRDRTPGQSPHFRFADRARPRGRSSINLGSPRLDLEGLEATSQHAATLQNLAPRLLALCSRQLRASKLSAVEQEEAVGAFMAMLRKSREPAVSCGVLFSATPVLREELSPGEAFGRLSTFEPKELMSDLETRTSLRLCGLPQDFNGQMLKDCLDAMGLSGFFDFVYVPIYLPAGNHISFAYGFVNCVSPAAGQQLVSALACNDEVRFNVQWSTTQGLDSFIHKYRNCSIMHKSIPKECKPILLQNGVEVSFPKPTKKLEKPRHRTTMIPPCRFVMERLSRPPPVGVPWP
ncbi:unnamed protein product [Effrenium voratum]|uniref:Uncharacterized protein n=1 Tax=Effrenium voratum TaxID=2562239 RepID=A0AA36IQ52_9DINO|nr:unnamed protein product [Effrenium voratum]